MASRLIKKTPKRNFSKKVNRKTRRMGLLTVLSERAAAGRLIILEDLGLTGKTKELSQKLPKFQQLTKGKRLLLVIPGKDKAVTRASRNLEAIRVASANNLNILDLLWADGVVVLKDALPILEKTYSPKGRS